MIPRLTPDADAEDLRAAVRDFLARHTEPAREPDQPWDPTVWKRLAGELGVVALDVPEAAGGAGATFREVGVVAEELGRSLARLPWFSTAVLGVGVLLHTEGNDELLAELAAGSTTATLAEREAPSGQATRAEEDAGGWRLTGGKTLVVEGATADLLFAVAAVDGQSALFVVDAEADGLTRAPMRALDPNRQLADVVFDRTPAMLLAADAQAVLDRVHDRAAAALACEQTGGAAAVLELSATYAAQRLQFGRPIGSFQAIKHRCADMAVRVEAARSASLWAAATAADDPAELPTAAATAALVCGDAYRWVAAETVQVHGGIGFTWEHPAHLHVRRAATTAVLVAEHAAHRETLLARLGI